MMNSLLDPPLTNKFQQHGPVSDDTDETDTSTSDDRATAFFTVNIQSSTSSSTLPKHNESLTASIPSLDATVEKRVCEYEEKFQEYEIVNADLQKRFNEKEAELKREKLRYTKLKNDNENYRTEMMQVVEATKKKKWCHHCWNEVTFNCAIDPPACSSKCLDELMASNLSPAYSISSESSNSSVISVHEENEEPKKTKNSSMAVNRCGENGIFHQNGNGTLVNGNNMHHSSAQLHQMSMTIADEPYVCTDISSLLRDLED